MQKKILLTGVAGYIGSVLARKLLEKGHFVKGADILNFGGESLMGIYGNKNFKFVKCDIRKKLDLAKVIKDVDSVVHLAAIVGDPACAKAPTIAEETNWSGSKMLFDMCNSSKCIKRFIFASTCSNYGKMAGGKYVDENAPLNPVSLYAKLKVRFEKYLLQSDTRNNFIPTSLRFATAFGISPRMRFDLTVNEFIKNAVLGKELVIFGENFWRPYCHVADLARACVCVLESEKKAVKKNVFNVGDTAENYQKKTIASLIKKRIPELKVRFVYKTEDPRDYCVNFAKINRMLRFRITKKVTDGIDEIMSIIKLGVLKNPENSWYKNI